MPLVASAHPVSCVMREFTDPARGRTLPTEICYPTGAPTEGVARPAGAFQRTSTLAAPLLKSRDPYPLLVISHGTGGHAGSLAWFTEYFAARGFVVVIPHHPGTTFQDLVPEQLYRTWNRPLDIAFILNELERTEPVRHWYDPKRIVMAGFSMGGYTTLAMAGARFSIRRYDEFCARTANRSEDCRMIEKVDRTQFTDTHDDENFHDPRLRAFFAMSPYGGPGMDLPSLAAVKAPVYLFALTHDEVLSIRQNTKFIYPFLPTAQMSEIHSGTHYALLGECTKLGLEWVPELCRDNPAGVRPTIHAFARERAESFFREALLRSH